MFSIDPLHLLGAAAGLNGLVLLVRNLLGLEREFKERRDRSES
jgi:hypothetical protein